MEKAKVLTDDWADPMLEKYQVEMSCGYKHYDIKICDILEAQLDADHTHYQELHRRIVGEIIQVVQDYGDMFFSAFLEKYELGEMDYQDFNLAEYIKSKYLPEKEGEDG